VPLPPLPTWHDYDPKTGVGDPTTPLSAAQLNSTNAAIEERIRKSAPVLNVLDYGAVGDGIADDTSAINAALAAANAQQGATVFFPAGKYRTRGGHALDRVNIAGPDSMGVQPIHGTAGASIHVIGTLQPAFTVADYVTVSDLTIIYPDQVDTPTAPLVYPPTFQGVTSMSTFCTFARLRLYNAYDGFDFPSCGLMLFDDIRAYTVRSAYTFGDAPETIEIRGGFYSFGFYNTETMHYGGGASAGASFNLRQHTASQGSFIRVLGDGSVSAESVGSVDALLISSVFIFGYRYGVLVDGGRLMCMNLSGGEFDAVETGLRTQNYGSLYGVTIDGLRAYGYRFGEASADAPFIDLTASSPISGAEGSTLELRGIWTGFTRGTVVRVLGAGWANITVSDCDFRSYGNNSGGTAGPYYGVYVDSSTARLRVADCSFDDDLTSAGGAIRVQNAQTATLADTFVHDSYQPVELNGSGQYIVDGLTVRTTRATAAIAGTAVTAVVRGLVADKLPTAWGEYVSSTSDASGAYLRMVKSRAGGDPVNGDTLGGLLLRAIKSGTPSTVGQVLVQVDGAPGTAVPGRFVVGLGSSSGGVVERFRVGNDGTQYVNGATIVDSSARVRLQSYTVATLPSAATVPAGTLVYVSNGASNKRLAVCDGAAWRWPDGAVVS